MRKSYVFLAFIAAFGLSSCSDSPEINPTSLSGVISNPYKPYIVISRNGKVLDTVQLDRNNRFHYRFKTINEGLYTFRNAFETQMFFIREGDSLRLYLNTNEFDKTLMYSGDDAKANNFLMKIFLSNEENNRNYYSYSPDKFVKLTDSVRSAHLAELDSLRLAPGFPDTFAKMAESIIAYAYEDMHERYFYLISKYYPALIPKLPKNFLGYRQSVNFNDKALQTYYIYQHFLDNYLRNKSVEDCLAKTADPECFDLKTKANYNKRLALADSLFTLKSLRSHYLRRFAAGSIIYSQTDEAVDSILDVLKGIGLGADELDEIEILAGIQKHWFIGTIGQVDLMAPSGNKIEISTLLTKPTVFFYWSIHYRSHLVDIHKAVAKLRQDFPQLNFVGVNIDNGDFKEWKSALKNFGYGPENEYQLVCKPKQRRFYWYYINKLVFVDTTGLVVDSNLRWRDLNIEKELSGLLQR